MESIVDLYEHANRLKPDNEELLSALFMAYVRVGNYQKQQRTAMALHKLKPDKNPYYFWALMSIVMQVRRQWMSLVKGGHLCMVVWCIGVGPELSMAAKNFLI